MPDPSRLVVRVRPGASRTRVGGARGGTLTAAVTARAVDGAATEAVLVAVAEAFGLRPRQVRLLRGATSREKLLELDLPPEDLDRRAGELRTSSS
ncbi:DUF167 domain-containing protein [Actinotalea sp. BY-33]|uniref:UPF0235 protein J4G33_10570 n=1 Tax=Actinotalea soli TaxID=2819234 RepID=A0A939RU61_9CELL|nr:DUF167 domain-containing protein [Actinotalea soli]MBO1752244.1 DUF167 domain-containing protein [Actinotalea soli]